MNSTDLFHQNLAEIRVSYSHTVKPSDMIKLSSSRDAYEALRNLFEEQFDYVEYFYILLLNRANKILGFYQLSKGGLSGTIADPKCVFQVALKTCASSIILAHNHPSGNMRPSEADITLTRKMKESGKFLDLPVMDHLIICADSYFSFADEGIL